MQCSDWLHCDTCKTNYCRPMKKSHNFRLKRGANILGKTLPRAAKRKQNLFLLYSYDKFTQILFPKQTYRERKNSSNEMRIFYSEKSLGSCWIKVLFFLLPAKLVTIETKVYYEGHCKEKGSREIFFWAKL